MSDKKNQVGFTPQPEGRGFSPTLLMTYPPVIIVHFSGGIRAADELETKEAVIKIRNYLSVKDINERWDTALDRLWDYEGDLILMEHDVVPTIEMAKTLLACPCRWGTQRYRLYKATTNLDYEVWGERYGDRKGFNFIPVSNKEQFYFCDAAPNSFTKLTYEFRRQLDKKNVLDHPDYRATRMPDLDHTISLEASRVGIKAHLHYPEMKHNHKSVKNNWAGL